MPERPETPLKRCALKDHSEFLGDYACTTFVALVMAKHFEKTYKTGRNGSSAAANGPSAAANGPSAAANGPSPAATAPAAAANGPFTDPKRLVNGPQTPFGLQGALEKVPGVTF